MALGSDAFIWNFHFLVVDPLLFCYKTKSQTTKLIAASLRVYTKAQLAAQVYLIEEGNEELQNK